ncbi:delta 8-sphingolipid desaturase [Malassezia pachydermatis]|uniref:Delta 8-(E)-sphingolipid desaturase n=1 Tax=Malassezia pachydermatis TaxID=77020 RepID=A0A0M9VR81_9BASI|nr:delta 8-sphingolipid desaturase [Malassezia pachydermatis]KOS16323.1 delta 8-sphingolipid desaturase [Malassezia pachydermatis]
MQIDAKPMSTVPAVESGTSLPRTVYTRAELARRIANGEVLVVHRRLIYKLDRWASQHPGGDTAILHFVGRDAKDEIEVYHSDETIARMRKFAVAQLAEEDATDVSKGRVYKPLMPPIQLGYRHGALEHPHAQLAAWNAYVAMHPEAKNKERVLSFPLPVDMLEPPPSSLDSVREARISAAFEQLHMRLKEAGMFELHAHNYGRECLRYGLFALGAYVFYQYGQAHTGWAATMAFTASSICLGAFWHQLAFVAHDAGHTGITHIYWVDRLLGIIVASYVGGLSLNWWCDNHDVHHLVTNHPEHDPDIQHMPIFAISPMFLPKVPKPHGDEPVGLYSSYYRRSMPFDAAARWLLRFQHKLYFIIMSVARFNLYALSYSFLLLRARRNVWFWIELLGLISFWTWFPCYVLAPLPSWRMRIGYLLLSHIVTSPLHIQIVLSHFGQDTSDLGPQECFASRQIRTTMDVECPKSLDFFHGGLHMQVTHHLFPRMPRHNLRQARDRFIVPFCREQGLIYEEMHFTSGNRKVVRRLQDVANQVSILCCVAQAQMQGTLTSSSS